MNRLEGRLRVFLLAGVAHLCAACASAAPPHAVDSPARPEAADVGAAPGEAIEVRLAVTHLAPGRWEVTYTVPDEVDRLRFQRDRHTFRHGAWEVVTPGLRLTREDAGERIEALDGGAFRSATLRFSSDATPRAAEYLLNPRFTDGSEALYTGLLYVEPERDGRSLTAVQRLELVPLVGEHLVLRGRAHDGPVAWLDTGGSGTYAYFGAIEPTATERVIAIVDPGLPVRLRELFETRLPQLFDYLAASLDHPLEVRPVVLLGYQPAEGSGRSSSGGVLPGLVRFGFSGEGWDGDDPEVVELAFYLLAHEAAHLWNNDRYHSAESRDAVWMHEGGAEVFAWLAMRDFGVIDADGLRDRFEQALNRCLLVSRGRPLDQLASLSQVPYACGAAINLLVGARLAGREGLFGFWRALFRAADGNGGGYGTRHYFETLERLAGDASLAEFLRRLLRDPPAEVGIHAADELRRLGFEVAVGDPPPPQAARALIRELMWALVQADCGDRLSVSTTAEGFRIHRLPGCRSFQADTTLVTAFAGHPLGGHPSEAYTAAWRACAAVGQLAVTANGGELTLTCPAGLPPYLRVGDPRGRLAAQSGLPRAAALRTIEMGGDPHPSFGDAGAGAARALADDAGTWTR